MHPVEPAREIRPARTVRRAALAALPYDQPSLRLRLARAYFTVGGALAIVGGIATLAMTGAVLGSMAFAGAHASATGPRLAPDHGALWRAVAIGVVTATAGAGWLWTGRLLRERRRLGATVAITTLLAPVVQAAVGGGPREGVAFAIVGALVVASVWNELE